MNQATALFFERATQLHIGLSQDEWLLNPSGAPARYFGMGINDSLGFDKMLELINLHQDGFCVSPLTIGQIGINRMEIGPRTTLAFRTKIGTVLVHDTEEGTLQYIAPEEFYICASLKKLFQASGECTVEQLERLFAIVATYHD